MRKYTKGEKSNPWTTLTKWSTRSGPINLFIGAGNLKKLPHFVFSTILLHFFRVFHIYACKDQFEQDLDQLKALGWIFLEDWRLGFRFQTAHSSFRAPQSGFSSFPCTQGFDCECSSLYQPRLLYLCLSHGSQERVGYLQGTRQAPS